jgi:hypothetical protein
MEATKEQVLFGNGIEMHVAAAEFHLWGMEIQFT